MIWCATLRELQFLSYGVVSRSSFLQNISILPGAPFTNMILTLIPAWISYIPSKVWGEITCCAVEV